MMTQLVVTYGLLFIIASYLIFVIKTSADFSRGGLKTAFSKIAAFVIVAWFMLVPGQRFLDWMFVRAQSNMTNSVAVQNILEIGRDTVSIMETSSEISSESISNILDIPDEAIEEYRNTLGPSTSSSSTGADNGEPSATGGTTNSEPTILVRPSNPPTNPPTSSPRNSNPTSPGNPSNPATSSTSNSEPTILVNPSTPSLPESVTDGTTNSEPTILVNPSTSSLPESITDGTTNSEPTVLVKPSNSEPTTLVNQSNSEPTTLVSPSNPSTSSTGNSEPSNIVKVEPTRKAIEQEPVTNTNPKGGGPVNGIEASETGTVTYVVQRGDSLAKISQKIYGNMDYTGEICSLNNIPNCNNIRVGMSLKLP